MEVRIVTKPAFAVIGIEGSGPADKRPAWIKPLWDRSLSGIGEIRDLNVGEGWGLMSAIDEPFARWKEQGKYLAGWEVSPEAEAPEGWTLWKVPETTFATIACSMSTQAEAWEYLDRFLKNEGYEQAGATHELYPPEFEDPAEDRFYLYVAIKKCRPVN